MRRDAIVITHDDCLVAFVMAPSLSLLPSSSDMVDKDMIKASLTDISMLTDYMIPWRTIIMGSFPLTHNGKIDCKAPLSMPQFRMVLVSLNLSQVRNEGWQ